jgi:hypothetical protein
MLPSWNLAGVLPPVRPGEPGHSADRSPYLCSLADVVQRFSTSAERMTILQGLLAFRAQLHQRGIVSGFQWLDGSFMEQVELLESRPPKDIDAVTYFEIPTGETELSLVTNAPDLFDHDGIKVTYHVDHYPVVLGKPMDSDGIIEISYWYSMWSHRRNGLWKGFVQVSLDPLEDIAAQALFPIVGGGTP